MLRNHVEKRQEKLKGNSVGEREAGRKEKGRLER